MKVLITYAPNHDSVSHSAKLAGELLRREGCDVDIVDLSLKELDILAAYDKVVLGGELWFGKFNQRVQSYIIKNQEELLIKPVYIFVHAYVGGDQFQSHMSSALPLEVLTHANTFNLGMDVDPESLNPWEKIRWKLSRQDVQSPADTDQLKQLVKYILQ